jgi:hypothetical protein
MELYISYHTLFTDKDGVIEWSIDYADNTLRGVIADGILKYSEVIFLKFSDYGIFFDNRYGNGYDITKEEMGLRIKFKIK